MKKIFASFLVLSLFATDVSAQAPVRGKSFGVSFIMNDFVTPNRIRTTSLSTVLRNEQVAKFKEMGAGLAISYFKGFTSHIDFAATLGGSSVTINLPGKNITEDKFLLELNASANFKMFTEQTRFNPYLIAGIGASKYTNVYGAFIPLGGGFKMKLAKETQAFLQLQYRVPVTPEGNDYHLQASLGISGLFAKK